MGEDQEPGERGRATDSRRDVVMAADTEQWEEQEAAFKKFKADIEYLVSDDIKVAGDTATETRTIFHYTGVAGALAIIETGHLWFTERAHLNDTLELQYGLRIGHEMFDAAVKAAGPTVPQSASEHFLGEVSLGPASLDIGWPALATTAMI